MLRSRWTGRKGQLIWGEMLTFYIMCYWWLWSVRFKYKPGYRSYNRLQIRVLSLVENLFFQKNPLQDLLSSLNAVV